MSGEPTIRDASTAKLIHDDTAGQLVVRAAVLDEDHPCPYPVHLDELLSEWRTPEDAAAFDNL